MGALCFHSLIVPPIEAVDTCLTKAERMHGLEVKALGSGLSLLDWRASIQEFRRNGMERGGVSGRLTGAVCPDWHCAMRFLVSFLSHKKIITTALHSRNERNLARFENVSLLVGRILNRS